MSSNQEVVAYPAKTVSEVICDRILRKMSESQRANDVSEYSVLTFLLASMEAFREGDEHLPGRGTKLHNPMHLSEGKGSATMAVSHNMTSFEAPRTPDRVSTLHSWIR